MTTYFIRPWPQPEEIWALVKEKADTLSKGEPLKFDGPTPSQLSEEESE
tara:strand:- start:146 stop:292 length:147 start_codon:yes stop_codon:yes gene_type:complete